MIEITDKKKCCGCTACKSICPKRAIKMVEDEEGFLYPVVDKEKCVNCDLCKKVCLYEKNKETSSILKCYAVQNCDLDILNTSTSGGFFDAAAKFVLESDGYVCGAIFDENFKVKHKIIDKTRINELCMMRESKYTQSDLNDCFIRIRELLNDKKLVLFSGTPCQVVGLKLFLIKDYENLITIDFCCRSVPSPLLFEKYKDYMENKYKSEIEEYHFRKKTYGYHHGTVRIKFKNKKIYNGSNRVDLYNKLFHSDKCSRYSCYNCKAKGINRISDFTIFDSWNPEYLNKNIIDNDLGYTNLFIHSEKGINIFHKIKNNFKFYEISAQEANKYTGGMLEKSIELKKERKAIYSDLNNITDFKTFASKYINISIKDKIIEASKKIIYKKH